MKTNFTKSDLKSGMAIRLRSGLVGIVMNQDYYCLADNEGWGKLVYYNEDLINSEFPDSDIVAVGAYATGLDKRHIENALENPMWERKAKVPNPSPTKKPNCITLDDFLRYVDTYMNCYNCTHKAMDILFGDPVLTPTIPALEDFQIEYIKMVAKLLRIKDEELVDELINWFFVDKCGQDEDVISFNQKQLTPAEVYEKVTQNRYQI